MALCNGMMQWSVTLVVGGVQWTPVFEKKVHHGHRAYSGCAMNRILAPTIANSSRRSILDKNASNVEVLLGGNEVKGSLCVSACVRPLTL